jgi:ribosomal protein S6
LHGGRRMNPTDPESAQRIVAEYAALLEQHTVEEVYPAPLRSLPYPKQVIKEAIHTSVSILNTTGQMTQELKDFLEIAYVSLADYVEDDVVRLMAEHRTAAEKLQLQSRAPDERTTTSEWGVLARTSGLAGQVAQAIAAETEELRQEFHQIGNGV